MNYTVTYNYIDSKCYLNFVYLVPRFEGSSPILARAIDFFQGFLNKLKKDYLFLATYSEINSITISLIVVCFLAAIIFRSVFNSSSIVMCSFVSLILFDLHCSVLFLCFYIGTIMYL